MATSLGHLQWGHQAEFTFRGQCLDLHIHTPPHTYVLHKQGRHAATV